MNGIWADLSTPLIMGILLGGLYTVIALGLSLVFGVMRLINVAHGDLVVFGSYFAYAIITFSGIDPILSLVMGVPLLFVIGFAIQRYLMARAFQVSMEAPLIIAFGVSLILENVYQIMFSPMSRGISTSYSMESFTIGEVYIPVVYLLNFIVALVVMLALHGFLKRTYLGQAIIASS
ncbi:MAG: branched-chain amino acid ABC transporter permease, partial [Desulfobacteraceae bacterium]